MIRNLERSDYDQVVEKLIEFTKQTGISSNVESEPNITHVKNIILRCHKSGVCLVALNEQQELIGILLSCRVKDIWFPEIIRLYEMIWWVDVEYRKKTTAARLLKEYQKQARILMEKGQIVSYTIGKSRKTDIDLEKHGFKHFESVYVFGE